MVNISSPGLLLAIILLFISGCTTNTLKQSDVESSSEPLQSLVNIPDSWTIIGRISVLNEQENWYAKFIWIQKEQDFQLNFTGPLGETELQISQIAQNVSLKTPSAERIGQDLEQLVYQETGWALPVTSLGFWSRGYPNPDMSSRLKFDKQQHISDIFQAGWHIQYPKRMTVEHLSDSGLLLPRKIIATREDLKIKLIITHWHLGESSFSLPDV